MLPDLILSTIQKKKYTYLICFSMFAGVSFFGNFCSIVEDLTFVRAAIFVQVQTERSRRMSEAAMLERHIMQAQARAMSADERELTRVSTLKEGFPDLGLPPSESGTNVVIKYIYLTQTTMNQF